MSTVTMTLYEALGKKKILEDRIKKAQSYRLCFIKKKHEDVTTDGYTVEEAIKSVKEGYQSSIALINNYIALKSAINDANAVTKIKVAEKEYTIANAIVRQRELDREKFFYSKMISNLNGCDDEVRKRKEEYLSPEKISQHVARVLGDSKKDDALIKSVTEDYEKKWDVELCDPLNTRELAEKKLQEIETFKEEIHFALNKANVDTVITVEYDD